MFGHRRQSVDTAIDTEHVRAEERIGGIHGVGADTSSEQRPSVSLAWLEEEAISRLTGIHVVRVKLRCVADGGGQASCRRRVKTDPEATVES